MGKLILTIIVSVLVEFCLVGWCLLSDVSKTNAYSMPIFIIGTVGVIALNVIAILDYKQHV